MAARRMMLPDYDNVERHADGSVTRKPKRYTGKKD